MMMKTPIIDFVDSYNKKDGIRLHMPGHKGKKLLGYENLDITEIDGADVLNDACGIILESEKNASSLFGFNTIYSTEGSSLCIRAMLFLAMSFKKSLNRPTILAARNVHKTFITAAALLDFDVKWLYSKTSTSYHSCEITKEMVEASLSKMEEKPIAVYITTPDYLGCVADVEGISKVCKKYDVLLLVDNAHGAYLKFLDKSLHPIDLGADMCASSAHKTLPCVTGGAYLQINNNADNYFLNNAKSALALFASTSPSYLILESLDYVNLYLANNKNAFIDLCAYLIEFKKSLIDNGYTILGNEPMKIVIDANEYGYSGDEISDYLKKNNIYVEFHDFDYVVLMPTPFNSIKDLEYTKKKLLALEKKKPLKKKCFFIKKKNKEMTIREAMFSKKEKVAIDLANNRILADTAVTCPPAVPIVVCGERITKEDIEMFKYYGVTECFVVKE